MNLLPRLENGLFALGQVLRFPVMALLWVCVASALFMAGRCAADWIARRRERSGFDIDLWVRRTEPLDADEAQRSLLPSNLRVLLEEVDQGRRDETLADGGLEHLVLESEERVRRSLTGPRMLVKVGPALGLIGTLIPMGTALASLAAGSMETMAGQMVVAFTTTIIGLATGTLAYVVAAVRLNWVNESVREQRFLAERVAAQLERKDVKAKYD